jgi:hypothetical protein
VTKIAGMKICRRLPPQVNAGDFRTIAFQARGAARKSDCLFDEGSQLFGLRQSRHDAVLARINQRRREVSQHRDAVFCWSPQFPMGFKMTHVSSYLLHCLGKLFIVVVTEVIDRAFA